MALGFKIADGYVEVHARYDKGELNRAAQQAADDNDKAFNKERERNAKSGPTRDTNRRIGREANKDFVRGVREQADRQKESPFIRVDNVKKDASRLGRVHVAEFGKAMDSEVDRRRNVFQRIGGRISRSIRSGILRDIGVAGPALGQRFIEALTFGQADMQKVQTVGKFSRVFAAIGTSLGAALATALIAEVGAVITAGLPVVLAGLFAVPIMALFKTGLKKEDGKWRTTSNEMGRAIQKLWDIYKGFKKEISAPVKPILLTLLAGAGDALKTLGPILANFFRTLGPGFQALMTGAFAAVINFFKALEPSLPAINAALKEWGAQLPGLATSLGKMIGTILANPDRVVQVVKNLFETLRILASAAGFLVRVATGLETFIHKFSGIALAIRAVKTASSGLITWIKGAWGSLAGFLSGVWAHIKAAAVSAWNGLKAAVSAAIHAVSSVIKSVVGAIVSWWKAAWHNKFVATLRNALGIVVDIVKLNLAIIKVVIKAALAVVTAVWKKVWDSVKTVARSAWNNIVSVVKGALSKLKAAFAGPLNAIKAACKAAWSVVKSAAAAAWNAIVSTIRSKVNAAVAVVRSLKSKITGIFAGAGGWLISAGRNIIQGLLNGINAIIGKVRTTLQNLTNDIRNWKGPPSKDKILLESNGQLIMEGLLGGLRKGTKAVKSHLQGLTNEVPGMAMAGGGGTSSTVNSSFAPNLVIHSSNGLNELGAANRRALVKDIFLALEAYRKDYVR